MKGSDSVKAEAISPSPRQAAVMSMTVRGDVRSSSAPATSMPAQKVMMESVNTTEVAERSQPNSVSSGSTNSDQA